MSNSQQKTNWSLQDNKRTKAEREAFKATGKTPKSYTPLYVFGAITIMFLISLVLTTASKETLEACLFTDFCFNSKDDVLLYTLYVFVTIAIIVLAVFLAYMFGKRFGNMVKQ